MKSTRQLNLDQNKKSLEKPLKQTIILLKLIFVLFTFCGFDAFTQPSINNVTGDISTTLTINGSAFTEKTNAKPLFWWKADFGETPSNLGRKTAWDGNLTYGIGTLSTTIVAPGSQQSYGTDHGISSGIGIGRVDFDSNQLYLHRKTYEDFDITQDYALETRINLISGTLNVGNLVTGTTSGATGTLVRVIEAHPSATYMTHILQFNNTDGTINNQSPIDFIADEQLTSNSGAVLENVTNLNRSFNFKTVRIWANNGQGPNNMHMSAQGIDGSFFRITPEYTDGATWPGEFTIQPLSQLPKEWKAEEIQYQASDVDITNGIFNFYQKGILGTDNNFKNRTSQAPELYNTIVQSQVSHNAQPSSVMYYDALYIDDTWHRVVISKSSTWALRGNVEVQIPAEWSDNQIVIKTNLAGLNKAETPLYLYVVDKNGIANENGFPLQSVLDTTDPVLDSALLLYPNPTSGGVTLKIPEVEKGWTYQIIAITGQILKLGTINSPISNLNLKGLSNGVYFILLTSEQQTETIGVIKK
jgi:hypothetical protein